MSFSELEHNLVKKRKEGRTGKEGEGGRRGGGREWVITHEYILSVVTEYLITPTNAYPKC